ncbi:MAG: ATP phosphoribosyltransferase [Parvularculaceae bacterium]
MAGEAVGEARLRIAVQKSGRLSDGSFELLKRCGLTISRARDRLYARAQEMPIDILLVRDDDIPAFVAEGACDLGIVGENVFEEDRLADPDSELEIAMRLGFARCRLMLAAPKEFDGDETALAGRRVATSYPGLTRAFLERGGVRAEMVAMGGAVEVAPRLKIADAICDIVSTGATLDANGLKPVATVFESEAILMRRKEAMSPEKASVYGNLIMRIDGVIASRDAKYVMMNAPRSAIKAITEILPGVEAPTILELAGQSDRVALHAVCRENVFWSTLEALKKEGASAILVVPIEKIMP